jgi:hypothetical protein
VCSRDGSVTNHYEAVELVDGSVYMTQVRRRGYHQQSTCAPALVRPRTPHVVAQDVVRQWGFSASRHHEEPIRIGDWPRHARQRDAITRGVGHAMGIVIAEHLIERAAVAEHVDEKDRSGLRFHPGDLERFARHVGPVRANNRYGRPIAEWATGAGCHVAFGGRHQGTPSNTQ